MQSVFVICAFILWFFNLDIELNIFIINKKSRHL